MSGTECPKCGQWYLKTKDNYCGYCGHLMTDIDIQPDEVILISKIVPRKKVLFLNAGSQDISVSVTSPKPSSDFIQFTPADTFVVRAGGQTETTVFLNERKLPPGFTEGNLRFQCMINEDERKIVILLIKAKRGPTPVLLSEEIDFEEVKEGSIGEKNLKFGNRGAVPLILKAIQTRGGPHLKIGENITFPIKIMTNKALKLPVMWDADLFNPAGTDPESAGFRLIFENCGETLFVPARAQMLHIHLGVDKKNIHIDPVLSKQDYIEKIVLRNNGNSNIDISRIESDAHWIQIIQKDSTLTLLSEDSIGKGALSGPGVVPQYAFKVLVRPRELTGGWHEGKVSVYTAQQEYALEIPVRINVILPGECQDYIGIDFGTSNSVIAIYNSASDDTELVEIERGVSGEKTSLIPSVLVFEGGHDKYKIGWEAESEAVVYPENTVRSIKRIMGYGNDREFYDKTFSPDELAGCIIKKLVELAETEYFRMTKTYYDIKHAIVTVPANFFDLQIRGILKACEYAELDTEETLVRKTAMKLGQKSGGNFQEGIILDEPSAAAIFYLGVLFSEDPELNRKLDHQEDVNFLIFDYGGGTLDVSAVQVSDMSNGGAGIKVLANKGNNSIGGDSIDLTLMRQLLGECKSEFPEFDDTLIACNFNELLNRRMREDWDDEVWKSVLSARDRWKKAAEDLKISLSDGTEASFSTDNPLLSIQLFHIENGKIHDIKKEFRSTVTRYAFEGWIAGILSECEQLVRGALNFADIDEAVVDYIIHTGRSSLVPAVRERIRSIFPGLAENRDILREEHLKVCVAKGAAMYGAQRRVMGEGIRLIAEGRKLPHAYGIGKTAARGLRRQFDEIIPLGSNYPTEETRHYGADMIRGRMLHLTFYQNSGRNKEIKNNPDIRRIGDITIKLPGDSLNCDVKFVIDANRKLDVYANDQPVAIIPQRLEDEGRWIG
ncbi:MAG: hypothetical protein B6245_03660 [Desulfobacteraceae bacterium 4572_88]|nr:MAG: hypothetical protein B6245_03660 [Desulfobacteraceae bacterium 4572_88]